MYQNMKREFSPNLSKKNVGVNFQPDVFFMDIFLKNEDFEGGHLTHRVVIYAG